MKCSQNVYAEQRIDNEQKVFHTCCQNVHKMFTKSSRDPHENKIGEHRIAQILRTTTLQQMEIHGGKRES